MLEIKTQDSAKLKCCICHTTTIFDVHPINERRATDVELFQQARERLGWLFTPNKAQLCSEACARVYVDNLPTDEVVEPTAPVQAPQGALWQL